MAIGSAKFIDFADGQAGRPVRCSESGHQPTLSRSGTVSDYSPAALASSRQERLAGKGRIHERDAGYSLRELHVGEERQQRENNRPLGRQVRICDLHLDAFRPVYTLPAKS